MQGLKNVQREKILNFRFARLKSESNIIFEKYPSDYYL